LKQGGTDWKKRLLIFVMLGLLVSCTEPVPIRPEMVLVEGGTFVMGHPDEKWNQPRKVTLDSFLMAKYPVTIGEWKVFLQETGLPFLWDWKIYPDDQRTFRDTVPTDDCPAQGLNWYYAVAYV